MTEKKEKINSFEELIVWQRSIELSVLIYKLSRKFPKNEIFGLTSQIRRASNSVSLNISEGSVKSTRSFINQLSIALGSVSEVLSASILANKLDYLTPDELKTIRPFVMEITKMLNGLINALESKIKTLNVKNLPLNS
jgi:four helix bundle protein